MMYHAAQHKQEEVHESALAIAKLLLERCPRAQARQFHRSMMHALVGVKETARKAVLVQMCAQLVFRKTSVA